MKTFFAEVVTEYMNISENPTIIPKNFSFAIEDWNIKASLIAQL